MSSRKAPRPATPHSVTSDLSIYYPSISTLWPVHIQNWERKERRARKFARVDGSTSSLTRNLVQRERCGGAEKRKKSKKGERNGKEEMRKRRWSRKAKGKRIASKTQVAWP